MLNSKLNTKWRSTDPAVKPMHSGHGCNNAPRDELVMISVRKDKKQPAYDILTLSFHPRAVTKAGWVEGDRLAFEYDDGVVMVERDKTGYRLCASKSGGQRLRTTFRLVPEFAALLAGLIAADVEIDSGRIAFKLEGEK